MATKLHFRDYNPKQMTLFPQRLDKDIAENDPVRVVDAVIDNLKLDNFKKLYKEKGRSPYHPKMMLKAVIYGYMNNLYSCRKIETALKRDIHFIWLAGYEQPDFNTINRFRNRVKDEINQVFTQLVLILAERGFITLDVEYIDGTKIESKANKYTFVWRKNTERNRAKLLEKIKVLLGQIDDAIAQERSEAENGRAFTPVELANIAEELNQALDKEPVPATKEGKQSLKERKKQIKQLKEHADKLGEYDRQMEILGDRNSYSKTDHDATFMRMKEDAMNNGQTKPGYNLQIGTEEQFITNFGIFQSPGDPFTMIPFYKSHYDRYGKFPQTAVADSGYGSEENYRFMEEAGIDAYVKYNMFHKEQRMHYEPSPFSPQAMFYNAKDDYYVCPMGQHLTRIGTSKTKTGSGYETESARYKAQRCEGCPLRGGCFKAKGDRIIEVNHRLNEYRRKARERLTSEEGVKHRGRRCIEPEAVFGQMKYDMAYKRFRHIMLDKVTMDFAFFAIAFNIKKMCSKMAKSVKNGENTPHNRRFILVLKISASENRLFRQNSQKSVA
jgi:transposase